MATTGQDVSSEELVARERSSGTWSWPVLDARALFVGLYLMALFVMAVSPTLDPDMWWHLRTGELILERGVPEADVFSFTVSGKSWITHEWLSQLFMWLVYVAGGFPGLILTFAGIIAATFWLVYLSSEGKPYVAVFVGLLAAFASALTWGARPQMFNTLFLALFVYLVEAVRKGRYGSRAFIWFPLLTIVWANLHSGYLAGVAYLVVVASGDGLQLLLGRRLPRAGRAMNVRQLRLLLLASVASLLAAVLNPSTFALWIYPFETLRSPAMQQFIQEWQAPVFREPIFWPFALMLVLGTLGWVYGRRPGIADLLLFLGTGAAGLLSARNIPLFAVVAAPIISRAILPVIPGPVSAWITADGRTRKQPPRPLLLINVFMLVLCLFAGALWVLQTIAGNEEAIRERYPVAAVDYLEAQGLDVARGYNDYGWGGYLIWRGIPVYVDGRADVYGDEFLFFYQQAALVQEDWREPLERYDVDYVLLAREVPLGIMLEEVAGWREAYQDEKARIFVRED